MITATTIIIIIMIIDWGGRCVGVVGRHISQAPTVCEVKAETKYVWKGSLWGPVWVPAASTPRWEKSCCLWRCPRYCVTSLSEGNDCWRSVSNRTWTSVCWVRALCVTLHLAPPTRLSAHSRFGNLTACKSMPDTGGYNPWVTKRREGPWQNVHMWWAGEEDGLQLPTCGSNISLTHN